MWVLTLVASLALLLLLQRLAGGAGGAGAASVETRAALALGSLILVAYVGGAIARALHLPRVTGFLLAGLLAGPAWLGIVRPDELAVLRVIADSALALVLFAVGCELRLAPLRAAAGRLIAESGRLAAAAAALPFLAVALVTLTVSPWFPLTRHQPFHDAVAVALLLGAVAAVSSPALAMGVLAERGLRGTPPRTVLEAATAQTIIVAALATVLFAVLRPLLSPGVLAPGIAVTALLRLAGAAALGLALGYLLVRYLTVSGAGVQAILLLAGAAFLAALAARQLSLDVTLMALAAGACVANVTPLQGERARGALQSAAGPVHLVYFALAGCALQFGALRELWPWVVLFAGLRVVTLRAGWRWAGAGGAGGPDGWLGLVPQGAFAITLGGLARQAFPEWGISLEALILAIIGVHAVAGPIGFGVALRKTEREEEGGHVADTARAYRTGNMVGSGTRV